MKLIGLLGGVGWESTSLYYRMLNEFTQKELGGDHTARILLHSVNNGTVRESSSKGDFEHVISLLSEAGRSLKAGGAEFLVMANNAMHQFSNQIEQASGLDLLHISDPTETEILNDGHKTVALLGTRATMEANFYSQRFQLNSGANVVTPEPEERMEVNRIIYDELTRGVQSTASRDFMGELIHKLHDRGAEAVVLGCSELTAIVTPDRDAMRIYDTTRLHAKAAVKRALKVTYA